MYVTNRERHTQAMIAPRSKVEKAIVQLVRGLQQYCELNHSEDSAQQSAARALSTKQGMSEIARGLLKLIDAREPSTTDRLDASLLAEDLLAFIETHLPATGLSLVREEADAEPAMALGS